jgi:hypothetical protein
MNTASLNKRELPLEKMMPIITEHLNNGCDVVISPKGISMLPMLRQGKDTVTLSPVKNKLKKYDIPLYKRDDGSYILHRIVAIENGYVMVGDNQFTYEKGIKQEQIIAVVSAFTRAGKTYSVNGFFYGLYCRFWHYSRPVRHFWRRGIGWIRRHLR